MLSLTLLPQAGAEAVDHPGEHLRINWKIVAKNYGQHYADGYKYSLQENYTKAEEEFSKSAIERPEQLITRQDRAICRLNLKNYKGALEDVEKILAINSSHPLSRYDLAAAYSLKGQALAGLGRTADAISILKKSISTNNSYAFSHLNLARIYEKQGKLQEALIEMKIAMKYGEGFTKFAKVPAEIAALEKKLQKSKTK